MDEGAITMKQDMVFWGVIISVAGAFAVMAWLLYVIYRNATKGDKGK
jgi:hypothetical protein